VTVAPGAASVDGGPQTPASGIRATGVSAGYSGVAAIRDVNMEIDQGQMVLLAGANGAGKSTTLMTLAGAVPCMEGRVELFGTPNEEPMFKRVRRGVGVVTEARTVFMGLTVAENLRLGRGSTELALQYFPELEKRIKLRGGLLSGGEQQMLALARVMAARPRVILADELSLGLAPIVVRRLLSALRSAANDGAAVLLVEQHVRLALDIVDHAYFMRRGRVDLEGSAASLRNESDRIREIYL
jgi:branched-chain amino acid transport system ATP-binding protein